MWKSLATLTTALATTLALTGCAGPWALNNDVSTYSRWPADRKPLSYAFERLPSQQAHPERQQMLEEAARPSLEKAGFRPAADEQSADVVVQLGARVSPGDRYVYEDPFWWHGSLYFSRFHGRHFWRPGFGLGYGMGYYSVPNYEREVAMLIRDRKTGQPLYEARATNDSGSSSINSALLSAMFEAVLKDFPHGGVNPRRVVTQVAS